MAHVLKSCKRKQMLPKRYLSWSAKCYETVFPGRVSNTLDVPKHIKVPKKECLSDPTVKNAEEQRNMRRSCKTAAKLLKYLSGLVKVGITTDEIDRAAHSFCIEHGVYPSPLHYDGFPKSICTSVNNVVCHGVPDDRGLIDGDIINIDVSIYQDGYHGDCSKTLLVGKVDEEGRSLVEAAEACLQAGIEICRDGCDFSKIGLTVEAMANLRGFNVIPSVAGHGIGEQFHEPPDIFHFGKSLGLRYTITQLMARAKGDAPDCGTMKAGMIFTIEPAITAGDVEIEILDDGWTVVTTDESRSAQVEHTILIKCDGAEILTLP